MWGLIIALGTVGSLVSLALREASEPTIKPALMRHRLAALARVPMDRLTLDQAEDGVVLSRKLGERDLEKRFAQAAIVLRKHRPKH
jgi:hypothetical protein